MLGSSSEQASVTVVPSGPRPVASLQLEAIGRTEQVPFMLAVLPTPVPRREPLPRRADMSTQRQDWLCCDFSHKHCFPRLFDAIDVGGGHACLAAGYAGGLAAALARACWARVDC